MAGTQRLFKAAAQDYIDTHKPSWKNAKHADQWGNTPAAYVYPVIGAVEVADVSTEHLVQIVTPIGTRKRETASRVRGRIECILDAEKAYGRRKGEKVANQ